MKWSDSQPAIEANRRAPSPPRLMRRETAGEYLAAPHMLTLMEHAGWIKPVVSRNRMTLFDLKQLDACIDRLAAGEFPEAK